MGRCVWRVVGCEKFVPFLSGGVVHYGDQGVFDFLGYDGEGGGGREGGKEFCWQDGGNHGAAIFLINGDTAGQGDVHANVFGENSGGLAWVADIQNMASMAEWKTF